MYLSDISIKRPVFAAVLSLLLVAFGLVAFFQLSLREYPDIDPPVVTISVDYPGAAANVVETQITKVIEERIAGVEGIRFIASSSEDGRSRITIEFNTEQNIDAATNDVRDRIGGILDDLPDAADAPEIRKEDGSDDVIIWLNLVGSGLTIPELTDFAERNLVDRFSVLDGVARVRLSGAQTYALRIWVDSQELAARGLSIDDVENTLRAENAEFPAGAIDAQSRIFTARIERSFKAPADFAQLVIKRNTADGHLVRLGEVARVTRDVVEDRGFFRGNQVPMVGLGIIKQSTANTISVAANARQLARQINADLPKGMEIIPAYDSSVFVNVAVHEVYLTLAMTVLLVVGIMYLFLGNWRATLIPAVTVPISLIATFMVLAALGLSLNMLTLLALVLGIGLVVDDAIVVLENIDRRMRDYGEPPLLAAFLGTRQVFFAVVATTLVLIAIFIPILFLQGQLGRLFSEFAITLTAAVGFSSIVALSLCAMLASQILRPTAAPTRGLVAWFAAALGWVEQHYHRTLNKTQRHPRLMIGIFSLLLMGSGALWLVLPAELSPREDRGAFFINVTGPEGANYTYMQKHMDEIERRLMPLTRDGTVDRLLVRTPGGVGGVTAFNSGVVIVSLAPWGQRPPADMLIAQIRRQLADLSGVRIAVVMRQGLTRGNSKPVQFVLGGPSYAELASWRDQMLQAIRADNPGLTDVDWDYKETKPQLRIEIDYDRAAALGVSVATIGRTLETMLGGRRVTTYQERGEEYDVIVEGERKDQTSPSDLANLYVRSSSSGALVPLINVLTIQEVAEARTLNRFNRVRALTLEANLAADTSLGEALSYLATTARTILPVTATIDYRGTSRDYMQANNSMLFVFALGLVVIFLVLAAQFESWISPLIILVTVPLAIGGGLLGLWLAGSTLNIFSQVALLMLIGLAAKNSILIVEFANQLRDQGHELAAAISAAARARFRPILMTSVTTAIGVLPLLLATGAGSETRAMIGAVLFGGVVAATLFTLFFTPLAYWLLARFSKPPGAAAKQLAAYSREIN